jgi:hypothetical protein
MKEMNQGIRNEITGEGILVEFQRTSSTMLVICILFITYSRKNYNFMQYRICIVQQT